MFKKKEKTLPENSWLVLKAYHTTIKNFYWRHFDCLKKYSAEFIIATRSIHHHNSVIGILHTPTLTHRHTIHIVHSHTQEYKYDALGCVNICFCHVHVLLIVCARIQCGTAESGKKIRTHINTNKNEIGSKKYTHSHTHIKLSNTCNRLVMTSKSGWYQHRLFAIVSSSHTKHKL